MNKVNLCWVLSDGRQGHEIQSMTLATHLSKEIATHRFSLRQPWETFAPRTMPMFSQSIIWPNQPPNLSTKPAIIITCGRKAAALGKHFKQKYQPHALHLHILNPKDQPQRYDLLLVPEHDQLKGANIIRFCGSIHPYSPAWFKNYRNNNPSTARLAMMIGNPTKQYFAQTFRHDLAKIKNQYPSTPLTICGSNRTSSDSIQLIKNELADNDHSWFSAADGKNPYQHLLATAQHLYVTTDSINMMNECAASPSPVTLLAEDHTPTHKHRRFIRSVAHRWTDLITVDLSPIDSNQIGRTALPYVIDEILNHPLIQNFLNSPSSFKGG